jgi:hypothetical protein
VEIKNEEEKLAKKREHLILMEVRKERSEENMEQE